MYINNAILKILGAVVVIYTLMPYSIFTRDIISLKGVRPHELLLIPFIMLSSALVFSDKVRKVVLILSATISILILHSLLFEQTIFNTINNLREIAWFSLGIILGRGVRGGMSLGTLVKAYTILSIVYAFYIIIGLFYFDAYLGAYTEERLVGESVENIRLSFDGLTALSFIWICILNYSIAEKKPAPAIYAALSLTLFVYISGSRSLILILLFIIFLALRGWVKYLILLMFVVAAYLLFEYGENRFNVEFALSSLVARNGPFINALLSANLFDIAIGKGVGQFIYIPWFEAIGINPEARNLDGLYQTLFIKVGLVGLLCLFFGYMFILSKLTKVPGALSKAFSNILYFQLLMGFTTSFLFSATSIFYGLTIGMSLALLSGDLTSNNSYLFHQQRSGFR